MHTIFWLEKPLVIHRHGCEDNIRTDLGEIKGDNCGSVVSGSVQGQVAGCCVHGNETSE
jgi:hypothetical protein